jgi:hypothetical protein
VNKSHAFAVRGRDSYPTPACAVQALIRAEPLPHRLWEPVCGHGAIVDVLRAAGHQVIGSDLVELLFCWLCPLRRRRAITMHLLS